MSQSSVARPLRTAAPGRSAESSPRLRVIEGYKGQTRRTLIPVMAAIVVLFLMAVVVPLVVNTDMARMAYAIRDQQVVLNGQLAQIETLEGELLVMESTQNLERKAAEIGMAPAGAIGVVSLEDHSVKGGEPAR